MTKLVPRSRLNITYRTHIDGVPAKKRLPLRILLLGDFTGGSAIPYQKRSILSIPPGTSMASFMNELGLSCPVSDPDLACSVPGQLTATLSGVIKKRAADGSKVHLRFQGEGTVSTQGRSNGLASGEGKVKISGECEAVREGGKLKFDSANLSIRGRVDGELCGTVSFRTEHALGPQMIDEDKLSLALTLDVPIQLAIPVRSMQAFTPQFVAQHVPEIRRMMVLRRLLGELRSTIAVRPDLRDSVRLALKDDEIAPLHAWFCDKFQHLQLPADARKKLAERELALDPGFVSMFGNSPDDDAASAVPSKTPARILDLFLGSIGLGWSETDIPRPLVTDHEPPAALRTVMSPNLAFYDTNLDFRQEDRFLNTMAALFVNAKPRQLRDQSVATVMNYCDLIVSAVDEVIQDRLQRIFFSPAFRAMERNWRGLAELLAQVRGNHDKNEVIIDLFDATKEEIGQDLEDHDVDILSSDLFARIYIDEYDRLGGRPFGAIIGLYEFGAIDDAAFKRDLAWLKTIGKICRAAHAPFIAATAPGFFGLTHFEELERVRDIEDHLSLPRYGEWNAFRESDAAAYIGLTLPRYLLRKPWLTHGPKGCEWKYEETIRQPEDYLWGNAAILLARNLVRSFEESGWCQHICGPRGGGTIDGLPVHSLRIYDHDEAQPPVEVPVADYRELQFARAGFIPLVHCKGEASATFFSARSIKKAHAFEDEIDSKNSDLVCNLAYTLSVTRIAHFVKRMVRDYVGTSADAPYIQTVLEKWLADYVTTVVNPDDLTLRAFPFKAIAVKVEPKPGPLGWYQSVISILPHAKFEGMDVELRLEAALGGA